MKYTVQINDSDIERIYSIPYFQNSIYHDLNIAGTLDFFTRRYVIPLTKKFDIAISTVVDCGAGHGWFSMAYILAGGKAAIAADIDGERLNTAKRIAKVLSVHKQMEFIESPVHAIPLSSDDTDIVVSIETLEHVGKKYLHASLKHIKEIASKGILITTPNKLFPVILGTGTIFRFSLKQKVKDYDRGQYIAHDTHLPFAHWLPKTIRTRYARIFGRDKMDENNTFLSPFDLNILLNKFKPASSCLTFQNYKEYREHYPFYLPYGAHEEKRLKTRPSMAKAIYYRMVCAAFRHYSYWVMPNLMRIFVRR